MAGKGKGGGKPVGPIGPIGPKGGEEPAGLEMQIKKEGQVDTTSKKKKSLAELMYPSGY